MRRKILCITGLCLLLFAVSSCSSKPEEGLLKRYFHAISLNDATTMSTMSLEPKVIEFENWKIVSVTESQTNPATLPDLNKMEMELKKRVEDSVGITLDASDALDNAKFEYDNARTAGAKRAAKQKIDEMQVAYDEQREVHNQVQKDYNEAKTAAAKEEEITLFSLGAGDVPNVRDFTGTVESNEVIVKVTKRDGSSENYQFDLRRYVLRDETSGITRRGRWIIVQFDPVG